MKKLALIGLFFLSAIARGEGLVIEITEGRDDAMPMAVVPFHVEGASPPEDMGRIIAANLERSGLFNPLPPEDMLSRPWPGEEIAWRDFRVLGSEYLLTGKVTELADDRFEVRYQLHDVQGQRRLLGETYRPPARQLRDVAHAISDRVFEHLTGIEGAFSTRILYVTHDRNAQRPYQLQYADADGHRARTILRSNEPIMSPSWSPDGRKVAYVSFEGDGRPKIFVHELATSERRVVSSHRGINGAPSWSPDGRRLALTLSRDGQPEIYTLDLGSGELTRRTNHWSIDTEPRWLPDGNSLIFTSSRSGGPQIYRLNLADGSVRRLTFEGSYNARPDITPDGRHLVFVHRDGGGFRIGVKDLERDTFNVVTETDLDESPSVAPNGTMVIYGTRHEGAGVLEAVSIDGRVRMHLPAKEGEVREPAWSPFL